MNATEARANINNVIVETRKKIDKLIDQASKSGYDSVNVDIDWPWNIHAQIIESLNKDLFVVRQQDSVDSSVAFLTIRWP